MVGADGPDKVDHARAAHTGDLRSVGLRERQRVGSDAPGGPDDQHLLSRMAAPGLQTLNGGEHRDRNDRGLREADSQWFRGRAWSSWAAAHSAKEPRAMPYTSSPGRNLVTPDP